MKLYLNLFVLAIVTACDGALIEGLLNTALNVNTKVHNVASSFFNSLAESIRPQQNTPTQPTNVKGYPNQYNPQQSYIMPPNNLNGIYNSQYENQNNQPQNFNSQPGLQNPNNNGIYNNPTGNYNVNQPGYQNPNSNGNYNPPIAHNNQPGSQNPNNIGNPPAVNNNNQIGNQNPTIESLKNPGFSTERSSQNTPNYEDKVKEDIYKILEQYPMNQEKATTKQVTSSSKPDPEDDDENLAIDIRTSN